MKIDPETGMVDFTLMQGEKMQQMDMASDEKGLLTSMINNPVTAPPDDPQWKRLFGE